MNSCYVAGVICARHSFSELYPPLTADSESHAQFTVVVKQVMTLLPADAAPVWQYPPLDAEFFSLFTVMPPQLALFTWQAMGCAALFASAYFLHRCLALTKRLILSLFVVFFPIFFTLKVGQQGVVLGVLPICAAFYLLYKKQSFAAGLVSAVTFLTSKYLFVVAFIAVSLFKLERRYSIGLMAGVLGMIALMVALTPLETIYAWLHSLPLSEKFHFDPHVAQNLTIFASLSALLLQYSPDAYRPLAKVVVYLSLLIIAVMSIAICWRVCALKCLSTHEKTCIVFACAFYLMPILQPHLLYYDLSLMMAANILIWHVNLPDILHRKIKALVIASVLIVDLYFVLFAVVGSSLVQPLAFVLMLFVLVFQILLSIQQAVDFLEHQSASAEVA